jgi:hypothetical protein
MDSRKLQDLLGDELNPELSFSLRGLKVSTLAEEK